MPDKERLRGTHLRTEASRRLLRGVWAVKKLEQNWSRGDLAGAVRRLSRWAAAAEAALRREIRSAQPKK